MYSGVFSFYETHGLPLDVIISLMWERYEAYPDWLDLLTSMIKAGRPKDRAFGAIESAINDACCYSNETKSEILRRLELLRSSVG